MFIFLKSNDGASIKVNPSFRYIPFEKSGDAASISLPAAGRVWS
jgi:hypothetical protein